MCPFTNYNLYASDRAPTSPVAQLERHFRESPVDRPDLLALYNDGSFFADREITGDQRLELAAWVSARGFRRLVVESLPQFMTPARLTPFLATLAPTGLTVGVGLQSATDLVREICVNTSFGLDVFEQALAVALRLGVRVKTYVMVKPPFLLEHEAIADVDASAKYLAARGADNLTLCPTRIADHTLAALLFQYGLFTPPDLWTVAAAVEVASAHMECRVAMQNLTGGDFDAVMSSVPEVVERNRLLRVLGSNAESGNARRLDLCNADRARLDERLTAAAPVEATELLLRIEHHLRILERGQRDQDGTP
jgi:hypothetical protein